MKKIIREEFISKAIEKHGNTYDYSDVIYLGNKKEVTIICKKHGPFPQTPSKHMQGHGCHDCNPAKKLNTEEFISKAIEKHGNTYDYSEVKYINSKTNVNITCKIHGPYPQSPSHHLNGQGCPDCKRLKIGRALRDNTENFIIKAKKIHGETFNYSKVEYIKNDKDVIVICNIHGELTIKPNHHLQGQGCPKCRYIKSAQKNRHSTEKFIEKAIAKHGNFYDYSLTDYKGDDKNIKIICPKHGEFEQIASSHLQKHGCKKCKGEKSRERLLKTTEKFVSDARKVHGKFYDYSNVNYFGSDNQIEITCPYHGVFKQTPHDHLCGCGCTDCSSGLSERICRTTFEQLFNSKFPKLRPKWLEGLELDGYSESLQIAFEHQGQQHYGPTFYSDKEEFKKVKERDARKKKICEKRRIKLFIIPEIYTVTKINNIKNVITKEAERLNVVLPANFKQIEIDFSKARIPQDIIYLNELKEKAKLKGGECLADMYLGSHTPIPFKCVHGHKWDAAPADIKSGKWCNKCAIIKRWKKRQIDLNVYEILDKYKNKKMTIRKIAEELNVDLETIRRRIKNPEKFKSS